MSSNLFICVYVAKLIFFCCFLCSGEIGLYEGCIVSCKIVDEVPVLDVVNVTACNEKDWEMLVSVCTCVSNAV